jgi:7-cyano-7-deazaguanine synthase
MKYTFQDEKALVLFSGGQDSTTCLFWAQQNFKAVAAISFFYGQKHSVEIETAASICHKLNVAHKLVDISFLTDLVVSNLFRGQGDVSLSHPFKADVPASFVPYRNMIFLTLAAAWASTIGAKHLITGVCETDFSGYADCRDVFIKSLQATLNLATDFKEKDVVIHTPLMWLTKAETFRFAQELGCLDFVLKETITCYNGVLASHDFGKGCAECPACLLRKKGYEEFKNKYQ